MNIFFYLLLNILIIGLFLYSKLLPYKDKLNPNYKKVFGFFGRIFNPLFNILKKIFTPYPVGGGVGIDMTQIVLLVIFLVILKLIH